MIPIIIKVETNSFGEKTVTLRNEDGTKEVLSAPEGEHYILDLELKRRGVI